MATDEELDFLEARAKLLKKAQYKPSVYGQGRAYNYEVVQEILVKGCKICTECRLEKPLTEFSKRPKHPTGYKSSCKQCDVNRMTAYRQNNLQELRLKDRIGHYMRKYGMTRIEALGLVHNREGLCEICRNFEPLVVDHCHTTGKLRGKICNQCNRILGFVKDDIDTLLSAVEYLERHSGLSR